MAHARMRLPGRALAATLALAAPAAFAAGTTPLDTGNSAWMLTATALVLFMTIPGLSLFYAGMVRSKNALSVMMQCFAITCVVTVLWVVYLYSLAFGSGGGLQPWVGGLGKAFMAGIGIGKLDGSIPETVFAMFQLAFAIITPALIVGAFAERMKFSALMWFCILWVTFVYAPVTHWIWGGGWMHRLGVLDFAGGTVVEINSGIAALVAAVVLGRRKGYPTTAMLPHNMILTVAGAGMLWVGWFGFNAGSELGANGVTGMAMLTTQVAGATAALTWMSGEWLLHGKPSALGIASGAVAGMVAITPAAGFVGPPGALVIGFAAGLGCFYAVVRIKPRLGYDDTLDCFGVHGVGGIIGTLLTGVFVAASLGGAGLPQGVSMGTQVLHQLIGVVVTIVYDLAVTWIILKVLDALLGLRVTRDQETEGLDLALHDERGYSL